MAFISVALCTRDKVGELAGGHRSLDPSFSSGFTLLHRPALAINLSSHFRIAFTNIATLYGHRESAM